MDAIARAAGSRRVSTRAVHYACINRLRSSVGNGYGAQYPQANNYIGLTLHELDRVSAEAEKLRLEKETIWRAVNRSETKDRILKSVAWVTVVALWVIGAWLWVLVVRA